MYFNRAAEKAMLGYCLTNHDHLNTFLALYGGGEHFTPETRGMLDSIRIVAAGGGEVTPNSMAVATNTNPNDWADCLNAATVPIENVVAALSSAIYIKQSRELAKAIATPNTSYQETLALSKQIGELAPPMVDDFGLSRVLTEIDSVGAPRYRTHFEELHQQLGSFVEGTVAVIGARPAMGKTTLLLDILYELALHGRTVFIQSCEMTSRQVVELKLISYMLGIPSSGMDNWRVNPILAVRVREAMAKLNRMSNFMISDTYVPIEQMISIWDQVGAEFYGLDYLQLTSSKGRYENREVMYSTITNLIQTFAKGKNARRKLATVLICSQLNRDVERREDKRPTLSDLRGSGAVEQDCSLVIFPYRPGYYDPEQDQRNGELIVAKNRYGQTGTIGVRCSPHGHFE